MKLVEARYGIGAVPRVKRHHEIRIVDGVVGCYLDPMPKIIEELGPPQRGRTIASARPVRSRRDKSDLHADAETWILLVTSFANPINTAPSSAELIAMMADSRARTLDLIEGLESEQLLGPQLGIVNPLLWEIGHLAWFHEHFILRHLDNAAPVLNSADALYDSAAVHHDSRWSLPLPSLEDTLSYMRRVAGRLAARLDGREPSPAERYLYRLTTFHEDMHGEAFTYSRQTLGYPTPKFGRGFDDGDSGPLPGDTAVRGGTFRLGAEQDTSFAFDNEKWAHSVDVASFRIARAPVTNEEFAAFVADRGYERRSVWSDEGWAWRAAAHARHPIYWREAAHGHFDVRRFDQITPMAMHQPVVNVGWYEADAFCRWAGRRLPSEAEWEFAASMTPDGVKRLYPWGEGSGTAARANLDGIRLGCCDVASYPEGDSAFGCRQMIGNVWEWTSSNFLPYPGFSPDIYADYSVPAFGSCKVLRGGAWITRSRLINNRYRNYFPPNRRDVYAGFRTVAL
jgi:iron(II)-dependent oxidoreductase